MTRARVVALVGAGYWGERLARNITGSDDAELRSVSDVQPGRARAIAAAFDSAVASFEEALADATVEAVVIATPASTHAALVGRALAAGRHVLVAKPLATSLPDAFRLAQSVNTRDRVVMCDQTYRYAPVVDQLRNLVGDPGFGPLRTIESRRTNRGHDQPDVDVFWDLAYHDLAILDTVVPGGLGDVLELRATSGDALHHGRPHRGQLSLTWPEGLVAHVTVDWQAPAKERTMTFTGDDHALIWDDGPPPTIERDARAVPVAAGPEPLAAVVTEFLAAIAEGRPASCGPAQELPILTVLDAASRSASLGGASLVVDLSDLDACELSGGVA